MLPLLVPEDVNAQPQGEVVDDLSQTHDAASKAKTN